MRFYRVALTGNVAAGKSAVLALFRSWGAAVTDADELARQAVEPGSDALRAIAARFGTDLVREDGTLDRAALRRRVMGNPALRRDLEAIVHPEVMRRARIAEEHARRSGATIVVHDIPLLFEALDPAAFDAVVLVDAPPDVRRERLTRLRGLSEQEADELVAAQLPSHAKRHRATFVIDNTGDLTDLEARARDVWERLQERAASA